ncbi:MAG: hypothetical protein NW701_18340, partial [Nitrospira sp.]
MKQSHVVNIASINATILAISIGTLGIMISMLGDKTLTVFQEILEKQPSVILSPGEVDYRSFMILDKNDPKLNTADEVTRKNIITSIFQAATQNNCLSLPKCPTPAESGNTIVTGLSALIFHYPFTLNSEARLHSVALLLKWQEDVHATLSGLAYLNGYRGQLLWMVDKYQETVPFPPKDVMEDLYKQLHDEEKALEAARTLPDSTEKTELLVKHERMVLFLRDSLSTGLPNFNVVVNQILNYLDRARAKSQETMPKARALRHYQDLYLSWPSLTIFVSLFVTSIFGIILPLSHQLLPNVSTLQRGLRFPRLIGTISPYSAYMFYIAVPMCGHFRVIVGSCGTSMKRWRTFPGEHNPKTPAGRPGERHADDDDSSI